MFKLCQSCRGFIATRFGYDADGAIVEVCNKCFMKIDLRLMEARRAEVGKLESWWAQGEAVVNR